MKHQIYILVVEDELEVMDSLVKDLEEFENTFPIETANNAEEALEVVKHIQSSGDKVGLILCDHVLPGKNGVDFLISLQENEDFKGTRKVLVTGQAGLEDTILAINKANLDHYIAKPWDKNGFEKVVIDQLTNYVINQKYNPLPYLSMLDSERLADALRSNPLTDR